jgi:hypothetical protein
VLAFGVVSVIGVNCGLVGSRARVGDRRRGGMVGWTEPGGCLGLFLALFFCPGELERARCVDTPC